MPHGNLVPHHPCHHFNTPYYMKLPSLCLLCIPFPAPADGGGLDRNSCFTLLCRPSFLLTVSYRRREVATSSGLQVPTRSRNRKCRLIVLVFRSNSTASLHCRLHCIFSLWFLKQDCRLQKSFDLIFQSLNQSITFISPSFYVRFETVVDCERGSRAVGFVGVDFARFLGAGEKRPHRHRQTPSWHRRPRQ